jgi:hypothetical protein
MPAAMMDGAIMIGAERAAQHGEGCECKPSMGHISKAAADGRAPK